MAHRNGFTLVELLVAIAIFAVLSALGWKIFDYLHKVKQANSVHEQRLADVQQTYQQLLRDSVQVIAVSTQHNGTEQAAFRLNNGRLSFHKTGVTDPLQHGLAADERIEYVYAANEKKLYRLKYAGLNLNDAAQPLSSELLSEVDQFQITVLNPNELDRWPDPQDNSAHAMRQLPRGLKVQLTLREVEYQWIFSLLRTEYLKEPR